MMFIGMDLSQLSKNMQIRVFMLKVVVTALALFIWLTYNVTPVDQPLDYAILYGQFVTEQYQKPFDQPLPFSDDQLQQTIDNFLNPVFHEAWDASPRDDFWLVKLDEACKIYSQYCNRIVYEWEWSNKDKYMYTALSMFFMASIDQKLVRDENLADNLQLLTLRQHEDIARGYASHTKVYMHIPMIETLPEFVGVLVHELGHVVDLWVIEWKAQEFDKRFTEFGKIAFHKNDFSLWFYELSRQSEKVRKAGMWELSFCSGYWMSNAFEDFAECFKLYLLNHHYFYLVSQSDPVMYKKYQFMANLFDWDYIQSRDSDVQLARLHNSTKKRARDTTRLQ